MVRCLLRWEVDWPVYWPRSDDGGHGAPTVETLQRVARQTHGLVIFSATPHPLHGQHLERNLYVGGVDGGCMLEFVAPHEDPSWCRARVEGPHEPVRRVGLSNGDTIPVPQFDVVPWEYAQRAVEEFVRSASPASGIRWSDGAEVDPTRLRSPPTATMQQLDRLQRSLEDDPGDASRWAVLTDALLEAGHTAGSSMAAVGAVLAPADVGSAVRAAQRLGDGWMAWLATIVWGAGDRDATRRVLGELGWSLPVEDQVRLEQASARTGLPLPWVVFGLDLGSREPGDSVVLSSRSGWGRRGYRGRGVVAVREDGRLVIGLAEGFDELRGETGGDWWMLPWAERRDMALAWAREPGPDAVVLARSEQGTRCGPTLAVDALTWRNARDAWRARTGWRPRDDALPPGHPLRR